MRLGLPIMAMVTAVSLGGCANMTTTEQRTLSGAGIGALGGAAIAAVAEGSVATGALIGAGVGAGAGYLYSRSRNEHHAAYHPTTKAPPLRRGSRNKAVEASQSSIGSTASSKFTVKSEQFKRFAALRRESGAAL